MKKIFALIFFFAIYLPLYSVSLKSEVSLRTGINKSDVNSAVGSYKNKMSNDFSLDLNVLRLAFFEGSNTCLSIPLIATYCTASDMNDRVSVEEHYEFQSSIRFEYEFIKSFGGFVSFGYGWEYYYSQRSGQPYIDYEIALKYYLSKNFGIGTVLSFENSRTKKDTNIAIALSLSM